MTRDKDIVGPGGYLSITDIKPVDDEPTSLTATFSTKEVLTANLWNHLSGQPELEAVRDDYAAFSTVSIDEFGGLEWNDDVDMSADSFYRTAKIQSGHAMGRNEFRAWMRSNDLIIDTAAVVLGISKRQTAAYSSGEKLIPRTILLACKGCDAMVVEEDAA